MEYRIDKKTGNGWFLISADEFRLYDEGSNVHTVLEEKLAPFIFSLKKIKAIEDYLAKNSNAENLQVRLDYVSQLEKHRVLCKIAEFRILMGYASVLLQNRRLQELSFDLEQETPMSLSEVSQQNLNNAFRNEDVSLVKRLCAGVLPNSIN